nr:hypothetical protein [uncultured Methanoregula sp.]
MCDLFPDEPDGFFFGMIPQIPGPDKNGTGTPGLVAGNGIVRKPALAKR